jgi:plasmid stabilization system protein ParE
VHAQPAAERRTHELLRARLAVRADTPITGRPSASAGSGRGRPRARVVSSTT